MRSDVNMCINWFRSQNSKISTRNLGFFVLETCDLCSVSYWTNNANFSCVRCRAVLYEERFKFLRDIKAKFRVYGLVYNFYIHVVRNDRGWFGICCNVCRAVVEIFGQLIVATLSVHAQNALGCQSTLYYVNSLINFCSIWNHGMLFIGIPVMPIKLTYKSGCST